MSTRTIDSYYKKIWNSQVVWQNDRVPNIQLLELEAARFWLGYNNRPGTKRKPTLA